MRTSFFTVVRRAGLLAVVTLAFAPAAQAQVIATFYGSFGGSTNTNSPFQGGPALCSSDIGASTTGFTLGFSNPATRAAVCAANPNALNPSNHIFAARITGGIWATLAGTYTMDFSADDGEVLAVNGTVFDNEWNLVKGGGPGTVDVNLNAGLNTFVLDYNNSYYGGAFVRFNSLDPAVTFVTPEPSSVAMMAGGLFALMGVTWSRRRRQ